MVLKINSKFKVSARSASAQPPAYTPNSLLQLGKDKIRVIDVRLVVDWVHQSTTNGRKLSPRAATVIV